MSRTKQELLQASNQVKKETQEGANTADRVGGILYDITEHIQDVAITPKLSGGTEIAEYTINGEKKSLYAPDGGGGGGGTSGVQKAYFLNIAHGVTPSIPSVNEYNTANNTFKHGSDIWLANNVNPSNYQDTWMMWAWFVNNVPTSIGGATKIYDSTQGGGGGTNGQDGEEIEWIYFRYNSEIDWTSQQWSPVTRDLHNYHGTTRITDTESFGGTTWYNHPQGIELNNKYEYASFRVSGYALDGKTRVWGATGFSDPILWSAYGKQGLDGDGVEYIFFADPSGTAPVGAKNRPETWTNDDDFQTDEYIRSGSDWEDNPIDLDSSEYGPGSKQWVSVRKKKIVSPYTEPRWQAYSEPALWSGVGLDGVVDGYTVSTDNPTMLVTTDSEGTVDSFTDSTTYEVFHNGTRVDYTDDPTQASTHFMLSVGTITPAISGISAVPASGGKIIVTLTNVTNFDGVNVSIPVVVHLPNGDTRNSKITVTGFAASEGGMAVSLYTGASVIRTDCDEINVVPASLPIGVREGKGENPTVYYSGAGAEDRGYHFKYFYDNSGTKIDQRGAITVAAKHTSLTVELYKDNGETFLESLTLPYVKDGDPGIGIAAVNYSIAVLSTSVKLKDNNVSGEIAFKVLKVKGGESPIEITSSPFNEQGIGDGETVNVTINGAPKTATYSSGQWTVSHNDTYDSRYPFSQIYVMSFTSTILASTTIPIIRDGDSSVQGLNAVVMRFRSYEAIKNGTDYALYGNVQNGTKPFTDGVIYKDIVIFDGANGDNSYYYISPNYIPDFGPQQADQIPPATLSPYQVNSPWQHFTDMGDASFQALLAKYAFVENLTAREIVVTDTNGHPVAGMTQGTAVDGDYTASLVPQNVRGNVRIWAGYDSTTGNLTNSKFYVTDEGFVHAENCEVEGKITADSGQIGAFQVWGSGALTNVSDGVTTTIFKDEIFMGNLSTGRYTEIHSGGIQILNPTNIDFRGVVKVNSLSSSVGNDTIDDVDDVNTIHSAVFTDKSSIALPDNAPIGTMMFVKSNNANGTIVEVSGGYIMSHTNSTDKYTSVDIGGESTIFVKMAATLWVRFRCGN